MLQDEDILVAPRHLIVIAISMYFVFLVGCCFVFISFKASVLVFLFKKGKCLNPFAHMLCQIQESRVS